MERPIALQTASSHSNSHWRQRGRCIVCRNNRFPVYSCKYCGGDLVCAPCKLNARRPCRTCGRHEADSRPWALPLLNPFRSDWLKVARRNEHYVVENALSTAMANAGHRCSLCLQRHQHRGECPLDVLACRRCGAKTMRCDLRFHEMVDCPEVAGSRTTPIHDLIGADSANNSDLPWSCPICLLSVTPVRELCSNGHFACSHCWMRLYSHARAPERVPCPVCRERLPGEPAPQLYHWDKTSQLYTAGCKCLLCGCCHAPGVCPALLIRCETCFVLHPAGDTARHVDSECNRKPSNYYNTRLLKMWSASGQMPSDLLSLSILLCNAAEGRETN